MARVDGGLSVVLCIEDSIALREYQLIYLFRRGSSSSMPELSAKPKDPQSLYPRVPHCITIQSERHNTPSSPATERLEGNKQGTKAIHHLLFDSLGTRDGWLFHSVPIFL